MIETYRMNQGTFHLQRFLVALFVFALVVVAGILIPVMPQSAFLMLGFTGAIEYALLAYARPFSAFVVLVFFASSAWTSAIDVMPGLSLMIGVGLIFVAIWLLRLVFRPTTFRKVKQYGWLFGLTLVVFISAWLNRGGPAGLIPVFTYFQLFLLLVLVANFVTTPLHLYILCVAIVASAGTLALLLLLNQFHLLPSSLTLAQTSNILVERGYTTITRAQGFWGGPNLTALQLTIAIPFLIEWWPITSIEGHRLLLLGLIVVIIAALLLTFSVGGMIGLVTIFFTKELVNSRYNIISRILRVAFVAMLASLALSIALPGVYLERFVAQINVIFVAVHTSNWHLLLLVATERGDCWQAAIHSIADAPLLGHGPGSVMFANARYSLLHYGRLLAAHNIFLSIGTELGLVGFALFTGLLISTISTVGRSWRIQTRNPAFQRTGRAIFIALISFTVQSLALDSQLLKVLWILLGMAAVYIRMSEAIDTPPSEARE